MVKYAVNDLDEIAWFRDPVDSWCEEKRHIPETIAKLEEAGVLDEFLNDHSTYTDDGDTVVDMEDVYNTLCLESDEVIKDYIGGKTSEQ